MRTLVAYAPIVDSVLVEFLLSNGVEAESVPLADLPRLVLEADVTACVVALGSEEDEMRIHQVRSASRACRILAVMPGTVGGLSPRDQALIVSAVRAGADGIVFGHDPADVLEPLRAILRGEPAMPRAVTGLLAQSLIGYGFGRRYTELRLSRSEALVCNLLAQGFSTSDIAKRLHLAPTTVRRHISSAARKADASNREELVAALEQRLAARVDAAVNASAPRR